MNEDTSIKTSVTTTQIKEIPKYEKLNDDNWLTWREDTELALKLSGLWEFVDPTINTTGDNNQQQVAMSYIRYTMNGDQKKYIMGNNRFHASRGVLLPMMYFFWSPFMV